MILLISHLGVFWRLEKHRFIVPWEHQVWNHCTTFNFSLGFYLLTAAVMGFNSAYAWGFMSLSKRQLQQLSPTLFSILLALVSTCQRNFSHPENSFQNKKLLTDYKQFAKDSARTSGKKREEQQNPSQRFKSWRSNSLLTTAGNPN